MRASQGLGLLLALLAAGGCAQSMAPTIRAQDLALKSGGQTSAKGWDLTSNGYVGTYIRLPEPADVRIAVEAAGSGSGRLQMNLVVNDARAGFEVDRGFETYEHAFPLPAGTHFVRVEFTSHAAHPSQTLIIRNLTVRGAEVLNQDTDSNAMAAADTYIEHFRRGEVTVRLPEVAPGTLVRAKLVRHAFNFGTNAPGTQNRLLIDDPPPDSDAARFQRFILDHFNMLVPSNAGKWVYHEPQPGQVSMEYADDILRFARRHNLRARMHTLIWETEQQPRWVLDSLDAARKGDEQAGLDLRKAISNRINYYVGDRARLYVELDVLNESLHRDGYWEAFGAEGIADIYNEAARVAKEVNPSLRLYLNEYNVLQWSRRYPFKESEAPDPYANWYREHVEDVIRAGGRVSGIGVQYYVDCRPETWENHPHSPSRIFAAMQNLSTPELPIKLTEFGIRKEATPEQAARICDETLRLVFGTPQASGFLIWGFWAGAVAERDLGTALVDKDWRLTPAGEVYERLMTRWTTDLIMRVSEDRSITFNGFYGDYEVTAENRSARFTHAKGSSEHTVVLASQ